MIALTLTIAGLLALGWVAKYGTLAYCQNHHPPLCTQWAHLIGASYWVLVLLFILGHAGATWTAQNALLGAVAALGFVKSLR